LTPEACHDLTFTGEPRQLRTSVRPKKKELHLSDRLFHWFLRLVAWSIVAVLVAIVWKLFHLSAPLLHRDGFHFFASQDWDPVNDRYGGLPFIYGTVVSSLLALVFSVPVSVGVALFLTEIAPAPVAKVVGFLTEMLAAIPSVVYGLWGIFALAPLLREKVQPFLGKSMGFLPLFQGPPYGVGMLAAGIILAIMITPTIATLCREVFRAMPRGQREAALALGATRWESIRLGVLVNSKSGILGAVILGLGRALGETMAVTMVIGNRPEIAASLFAPGQTLASAIANEYAEATSAVHLQALTALGLALFMVSLIINSAARFILWLLQPDRGGARR
jgi:phosphate transport system permease protein